MNLADRIQQLRKRKGISQEELADRIGVSRQAVSKWGKRTDLADLEKIVLLSDYFEVTTDYLLKGVSPAQAQTVQAQIEPAQTGSDSNRTGSVCTGRSDFHYSGKRPQSNRPDCGRDDLV